MLSNLTYLPGRLAAECHALDVIKHCRASEGKTTMGRLFAFVLFSLTVGRSHSLVAQRLLTLSAVQVDSIVEAHRAKYQVPGVAVYVGSTSGQSIYEHAYGAGRLSPYAGVRNETEFYLASVSKPYAAAVAHRLVDQGRLDLSAPISRYLSDLPPWADTVTTHHLLTHTSGIQDYTDIAGWSDTSSASEFIHRALALPRLFPAGTRSAYSNTNYALLQEILERVTGEPYSRAATELVLRPLGLAETHFDCASAADAEAATGYRRYRLDTTVSTRAVGALRVGHFPDAAAGLCASARDAGRFLARLLSTRFLADSSAAAMHTSPSHDDVDGAFGEGLSVARELTGEVWSHGGAIPGFNTEVAVWPADSLVVIVLMNLSGGEAELLSRTVAKSILRIPQPTVLDLPIESTRIGSYSGQYQVDVYHVGVTERNSRVYMSGDHCYYQGFDTFICDPDKSRTLHFIRRDGQVREVWVLVEGVRRLRAYRSLPTRTDGSSSTTSNKR